MNQRLEDHAHELEPGPPEDSIYESNFPSDEPETVTTNETRHTVRIQVIKIYDVGIQASSSSSAIEMAYAMQSTEIEDTAKLVDVTTEFAEIV